MLLWLTRDLEHLSSRWSSSVLLFPGIVILASLGFLTWVIIQHQKMSKNYKTFQVLEDDYGFLNKVALKVFLYEELELATSSFSTILGQGRSGCVHRGMLRDGTCVAVKRIEGGQKFGEREFLAEVAAMGCVQVHHMNLVPLYGYCIIPKGPRFLVYKFIQNGSLDHWIFPPKSHNENQGEGFLPWKLRYQVAIDVARALSYLHDGCKSRILHLDVKPENILLDGSYRALLSDFGMATLMKKEESMVVTRVRGTKGYLAPEWILEKGVSPKSDVYSYGMVLLEMIGGRRNFRVLDEFSVRKWEYFPKMVFENLKEGKLMEVVDKRLLGEGAIDENEVRRLVYVALWCIQEKVKLRPTMAQVVDMLEGRLPVDEPPETEMFFFDLLLINNGGKQWLEQARV